MKIVTSQQMQELDRQTIAEGTPGIELMERAGKGVFDAIKEHFPEEMGRGVVVLCGKGNNGGDGFVVARHCLVERIPVSVFLLGTADTITGDARTSFERYRAAQGACHELPNDIDCDAIMQQMHHAGVIVDALLGTGLSAPVKGGYRQVIEAINRIRSSAVVAVDIPSGVDGKTGEVLGAAVRADLTCTFGLPKRGLVVMPGAAYVGKIVVVDIGIPSHLIAAVETHEYLLTAEYFHNILPRRRFDAHKGMFGHVLVIAGSPGMTGAAALAGQAAMRAGAGLVTVAVPAVLNPVLEVKLTEVMTLPLPDGGSGYFGMEACAAIKNNLNGKTVLVIGPGISRREETESAVRAVLNDLSLPVVIDADGLYAVAHDPACLRRISGQVVLTPHPGEMARLMRCATEAVQRDRIGCARTVAREFSATVVLKGAFTVVADPGGDVFVNTTGNPGMASGGMGDALTGIIAGLIAQGLSPLSAAQLGVFVHGRIGDIIAHERAPLGILATDIIDRIPQVVHGCTHTNFIGRRAIR
ncbi:MAG: NAD(P)H-hydrate dehydratase [Desulfobacterota bacterium]|nr:NAD(P)H-hydrate dehydratase [Thermodesulfobacteriota bacterium]